MTSIGAAVGEAFQYSIPVVHSTVSFHRFIPPFHAFRRIQTPAQKCVACVVYVSSLGDNYITEKVTYTPHCYILLYYMHGMVDLVKCGHAGSIGRRSNAFFESALIHPRNVSICTDAVIIVE